MNINCIDKNSFTSFIKIYVMLLTNLWCAIARVPIVNVVDTAKQTIGICNPEAIAKPHHSIISPKKLAPETNSKNPP